MDDLAPWRDLEERARAWMAADPDPRTRAELAALLEEGDRRALAAHVGGGLRFGTAGLRAPVGPGPLRMNRAVVIRTTRGLVGHLQEVGDAARGVVVGFDARPDSRRFALDAVGVLVAAGVPVRWWPTPTPTPLVAYTARVHGAGAAVVVTASHNPPGDNGYKLYGRAGRPVTRAVEESVEACAREVGPADEVARVADPEDHALVEVTADDLVERYLSDCAAARPDLARVDRSLPIVYTALHGVGGGLALRALRGAGFGRVTPVASQQEPDGRFPTVAVPNPEEPGSLELALATARHQRAELVLANDPDADRLAVALPGPDGDWTRLSGDEVGLLLTEHLLSHTEAPRPLVVSTVVSSPGGAAVAAHHGARWETTLTGFKWIMTAARTLEASEGLRPVLGWEEALGYSVGRVVDDKDGVAAAVAVAELAGFLRATGRSLWDLRRERIRRDGLWVSRPVAVRTPPEAGALLDRATGPAPRVLGPCAVTGTRDLRTGGSGRPPWLPDAPVVLYELDRGRVAVRPSGTEPKVKLYVHLRGAGASEEDLLHRADEVAQALADHLGLPGT